MNKYKFFFTFMKKFQVPRISTVGNVCLRAATNSALKSVKILATEFANSGARATNFSQMAKHKSLEESRT